MSYVMLVIAAIVMVVLVSIIRRHRHVEHDMWVKMVGMECEIDRLRGMLGPSTVTIGCAVEFNPRFYVKGGAGAKEYISSIVNKACDAFSRCISKELAAYIGPMVVEGMWRSEHVLDGVMNFRMPMMRSDFKSMTCHLTDNLCPDRVIPVVSEDDRRKAQWNEHLVVEQFKGVLDSLHVDTKSILEGLKQ